MISPLGCLIHRLFNFLRLVFGVEIPILIWKNRRCITKEHWLYTLLRPPDCLRQIAQVESECPIAVHDAIKVILAGRGNVPIIHVVNHRVHLGFAGRRHHNSRLSGGVHYNTKTTVHFAVEAVFMAWQNKRIIVSTNVPLDTGQGGIRTLIWNPIGLMNEYNKPAGLLLKSVGLFIPMGSRKCDYGRVLYLKTLAFMRLPMVVDK